METKYDSKSMRIYRRNTTARARFIRVLAREIANIRGTPGVCEHILKQAIEYTNKGFPGLEKNTCTWDCKNNDSELKGWGTPEYNVGTQTEPAESGTNSEQN